MKIVCAWCGADMGKKECSGIDSGLVSHSICERCFSESMAELDRQGDDSAKK